MEQKIATFLYWSFFSSGGARLNGQCELSILLPHTVIWPFAIVAARLHTSCGGDPGYGKLPNLGKS